MTLLTPDLLARLRAHDEAHRRAVSEARPDPDPVPVVKLFSPVSAATWLATEIDDDGDTLFGLADLGFGCPELGSFSLREIEKVRLPFGLRIERDLFFETLHPLSVWAETARACGSILAADQRLAASPASPLPPSPDPDRSGEGG